MPLTSFIRQDPEFLQLAAEAGSGGRAYAPSFFQAYLLAALREEVWPEQALLVVAPAEADASRLAADLRCYANGMSPGRADVLALPGRASIIGSGGAPSNRCAGERHAAMELLASGRRGFVVADASALMERGLHPGAWPDALAIAPGQEADYEKMVERLALLGYERVHQVEEPGQFAVRGGIIDVFACNDPYPARLEFWGDEIESVRSFSPFTQRSHTPLDKLTVYGAAEPEESSGASPSAAGGAGAGVLAQVQKDSPLVLVDPELIRPQVASLWEDAAGVTGEEEAALNYLSPDDLMNQLDERAALILEGLPREQPHSFPASGFRSASAKPSEAAAKLERMKADGLRVFVVFSTEGAARRAEHTFEGKAEFLEDVSRAPQKPGAYLIAAALPEGFVSAGLGLAVFGERALIRPGRAARRRTAAAGRSVLSFRDLYPGDYVVHEDHGIGLFDSIQTKTVAGVTRDYLELRFKGDDRLFVPQEQIDKVSRYVGATASPPPLSKLGGKAWAQARAKARRAAREMAGELLQLYAVRGSLPGHAFAPDDEWQMQLEAAFPYIETPDQAAAIEDVKDDMESPHPMDRLICGDVGYGKTEVALRAAFKAASQGKQVLMLVPTTILALQHFKTFSARFAGFPVVVEMISRFRTAAEGRKIAAGFREGKIDVLIGTHRLLSADIIPKDLGLVIVDEEQRFGVTQKEALRQLRLKVDVLTLSATPIPRTLQMSLSGVRDISVMETPPPGRFPIRTYVGEYDDTVVTKAVLREQERGGQVFFLHNRVETIEEKAQELRQLLPDLRLAVAHGQMAERQLETVMVSFLEREADVLVCTSIIESGLDIPTANTLIVDRADALGLAQLYQIRGRIGRSDVVAHAYLLYPPYSELSREAAARLSTLSDYSDLGAGFKIAMRDLEIRGAGNLLGDEQSGHVAAVGFEMYCDLIRAAVADLSNEPVEELKRARLDIDVDAYIPGDYIPLEAARIDAHHRIAAARGEDDLGDLKAEFVDRFGAIPDVVVNLFAMQQVRLKAGVLGAQAVIFRRGRLEIADVALSAEQRQALEASGLKFAYYAQRRSLVVWPVEQEPALIVVRSSLDAIIDSLLTPVANL